ncbi:MAG: V-type ATP synthase subunit A [Candidatus Paraimprobicoccus trichonymphae]|uniref:V-type ATP synthase alpha chain n=1 Tax=Candidatus Paraimprobicoccus trichonymphae TaxID=3033793 RepID=A0AA48I5R8_9FIRM|nr:MAG: V-type ATP synthase subunit A [Candidatus Paraimprobicoccus trichonymphae]
MKDMQEELNYIYGINGPVVTVKNARNFSMSEMVYVGEEKLVGEVVSVNKDLSVIQVYEETTGLRPGEIIIGTGGPMKICLGPGILNHIFDGIGRPLRILEKKTGSFISKGFNIPSLDEEKLWEIKILVNIGDYLEPGRIFASCPETGVIEHKFLVPCNVKGKVIEKKQDGKYKIYDDILVLEDIKSRKISLNLCQYWPIRSPRKIKKRLELDKPLVTGQRVIDTLFPIAKGGTAAIPGGFGAGKTMTQHQLAKWCDADIIVYVGCGERGNEMNQVIDELSELIDPKSGLPMTERTILIANTSNMPVAAREASIYTGITLAEYYRDMGYHIAIMADSTSRWAEALREISGRLEEMPAEEGFPSYLPSRLSEFYERAGNVETLGNQEGSVTIIGAVSPQGADFSEPVTQNTKRFVRCFWALDKNLAYYRHYPAINWNLSYSEYFIDLDNYYTKKLGENFIRFRKKISYLLHEETKLMEIVKLIGTDVLPDDQKLIMEISKVIRIGFLQQNAFHKDDTYVPLEKQSKMMNIILYLYKKSKNLISISIPISKLTETGIFDKLIKIKYDIPNDKLELFDNYFTEIDSIVDKIIKKN